MAENNINNTLESNVVEKPELSPYASSLPVEELGRYIKKVQIIGIDPYLIQECYKSHEIQRLPDLTSINIMAYLISTSSPYTSKNFQAYKSSEAYNQFSNGWLFDTSIYTPPNHPGLRVVFGQAIREKALRPWVVATNGRIHSAHCNCKAGLGEVCTHIATLLFGVDAGVRVREKMTVTQVKAYWMDPPKKQVAAAPISAVDFSSASKRKRRLDEAIDGLAKDTNPYHNPPAAASCSAPEVMKDSALKELIVGLSLTSP